MVVVVTPSCHHCCHSCIVFAVILAIIVVGPWLEKVKGRQLVWSWILGSKVPYLVMVIRSNCLEFGLCSSCPSPSHCVTFTFVPFFLLTKQHTANLSLNHPTIGPQVAHLCPCRVLPHGHCPRPSLPTSIKRTLLWPGSNLLACTSYAALWSHRQIQTSTWTLAAYELGY